MIDPVAEFGQIDIYLFDQILRGRIAPGQRIVDAGCGGGRNLVYFFKNGFEIFGVDGDPRAIASVRSIASAARADTVRSELQGRARRADDVPERVC